MVEPADMPIIKIFVPSEADSETKERMTALKEQLSPEKTRRIRAVLKKFDVKAVIISPEPSDAVKADTGAEYVFHALPGQRPLTDAGLSALAREAGQVLDIDNINSSFLGRTSEEDIARDHKIKPGEVNPVTEIVHELSARPAGQTKSNA